MYWLLYYYGSMTKEDYQKHKKECRDRAKRYNARNKASISIKRAAYYQKNKARIQARQRERINQDRAAWDAYNRDKVKEWRKTPKGKELRRQSSARYFRKHPENSRKCVLKKKYGITIPQYSDLVKLQGGGCAICGAQNAHPSKWGTVSKQLAIDHCH